MSAVILELLILMFFVLASVLVKKENRFFILGAFLIFCFMSLKNFHPSMVDINMEDMVQYIDFYMGDPDSMYGIPLDKDSEIEPGLGLVCKALGFLPKSEFFFVLVMRLICLVPVFYAIWKHSYQKCGSLFLLLTMPGLFLVEMITLRQALAMSCMMMAVLVWLERPKYWLAWALFALGYASITHSTSLVALPLLVAIYFIPFHRYVFASALLLSGVLAGIFASRIAGAFVSVFAPLESLSRMTDYVVFETYSTGEDSPLLFLGYAVIGMAFVWFADQKDSRHIFFVKTMSAAIFIFNILGRYPLVDRLTAPLFFIGLVGAFPRRDDGVETPPYRRLSFWVFLGCMGFLFMKDYLIYSADKGPFQPYHFIFEKPVLWMFQSL